MAAPVILVEAQPRHAADGVAVAVRLAGLGGLYPYFYGEQHYSAGIAGLPRTIAALDFDGEQLGGGGVPQAMELRWSPAGRALLADVAALYWADAPITVRIGAEGDALPPIAAAGLVLDAPVEGGALRITLSDAAADLKKALLTDRFAGTGGIEGPVELEGIIKSRAWGRCFNVPGQLIDRAANIWCFGDPRRAWRSFVQVRDRGVALTVVQLLSWQGSAEATFAALKVAAVADGGCIVCPSIACVKMWTQASGDLKADIEGETAGGYVEAAPEIVARLVAVRSAIPIAAGALADAVAWRPAPTGWRIDNDTTTAADAISELLGDVSLSWLLIGGELRFRRWEWTASTRVARSHRVTRRSTVKPLGTRKLGYRRNWSPMARGDLAAIVLAQDVAYGDGQKVSDLQPAQKGADVTGQNTAKDTSAVAGRPAGQVTSAIDANTVAIAATKAAIAQADSDIAAARADLSSDVAVVRAQAAAVASNLSAEVDRAKGAEGTLTTKVETAQGRADAAYTAVTDETINRAAADSALAGRVSTTEAQLRGDQDSTIAARVRDEAAARASQDSAIAGRVAVTEASSSGITNSSVPNDQFSVWADPSGYPANWSTWWAGGNYRIERLSAANGSPYAIRTLNDIGDVDSGFWQAIRGHAGKWLVTVTAQCIANSMSGAGVTLSGRYNIDFMSDPDTNGLTGDQGDRIRTWTKMFDIDQQAIVDLAGYLNVHAMVGWTGFNRERVSKYVQWYRLSVRPATAGEILGQKGVADAATVSARVSDEVATRASQDSALASRASSLESRAGSLEARVSSAEGALTDVRTKTATAWSEKTVSVPGAAATVRLIALDANGVATSQVALVADQIALTNTINGQPVAALTAQGGNIMIANDLRGGAGRIIFDNGSVMKVMGTGFGSGGQFIEWFGPRKANLSECTEANATYYLKTDGSSFFGGSLSAGTIKNAIGTTSTASNASVTTGDVGSRGGSRVVVLSYSWSWNQSVDKPQNDGSGHDLSAQIVLSRNGTDVATLTATGEWDRDPAFSRDEPGGYREAIGGSLTFTDNSGGSSVSYAARLTVRNTGPGPENGSTRPGVATQRISIVQTEQ